MSERNLKSDLTALLNRYSAENGSNTPDHILAYYMLQALTAYETAVISRDRWFGWNAPQEWPSKSGMRAVDRA